MVKDQAVIASGGHTGFAHPSGVSRTLSATSDETLSAALEVVETVSQPFIDAEGMVLAWHGQALVLNADLTGE